MATATFLGLFLSANLRVFSVSCNLDLHFALVLQALVKVATATNIDVISVERINFTFIKLDIMH